MQRYINRSSLVHFIFMTIAVVLMIALQIKTSPAKAQPDLSTPLLVSNRNIFKLCVNSPTPSMNKLASDQINMSLVSLQQHPDWRTAYREFNFPIIENSCSFALPDREIRRFENIGPGLTEAPSAWRAVVIVLDDSDADTVMGSEPAILATYEMMKMDEHNNIQVTPALLVRESFLGNPEFLAWYLPLTVGLAPQELRHSPEEHNNVKP